MSIAISHNMDNVDAITQTDLNKYMGLTAGTGNTSTGGFDASQSKYMLVDPNGSGKIGYQYTRGGVTLTAVIDVGSQAVSWSVNGITYTANQNRFDAVCEGLKIPKGQNITNGLTENGPAFGTAPSF